MDYKSLYKKYENELNEIKDIANNLNELCKKANAIISKLFKEDSIGKMMPLEYFNIAWDRTDKFIDILNRYERLIALDLDFNLNGDINYYKGSNIRVVQYGNKFAVDAHEKLSDGFGSYFTTTSILEKFNTLEEAQNYIIELVLDGRVEISNNIYRFM